MSERLTSLVCARQQAALDGSSRARLPAPSCSAHLVCCSVWRASASCCASTACCTAASSTRPLPGAAGAGGSGAAAGGGAPGAAAGRAGSGRRVFKHLLGTRAACRREGRARLAAHLPPSPFAGPPASRRASLPRVRGHSLIAGSAARTEGERDGRERERTGLQRSLVLGDTPRHYTAADMYSASADQPLGAAMVHPWRWQRVPAMHGADNRVGCSFPERCIVSATILHKTLPVSPRRQGFRSAPALPAAS